MDEIRTTCHTCSVITWVLDWILSFYSVFLALFIWGAHFKNPDPLLTRLILSFLAVCAVAHTVLSAITKVIYSASWSDERNPCLSANIKLQAFGLCFPWVFFFLYSLFIPDFYGSGLDPIFNPVFMAALFYGGVCFFNLTFTIIAIKCPPLKRSEQRKRR